MPAVNLNHHLKLTRPLAVLDLETTGIDTDRDRIVQIGLTIHYTHRDPIAWMSLVNPGILIPKEVTEDSHRITDDDVKDAPTFAQIGPALAPKLVNIDFAGYNVMFDLKMFRSEMKRAGVDWDWEKNGSVVIDCLRVYQQDKPRRLEDAYKEYVDPEGFKGAHDAANDVAATEAVLAGQLARLTHLPRTVPELAAHCWPVKPGSIDPAGKFAWINGVACVNFGKHKGKPISRVDQGYLQWMLNGDFALETKAIVENALRGILPEKA